MQDLHRVHGLAPDAEGDEGAPNNNEKKKMKTNNDGYKNSRIMFNRSNNDHDDD